VEPGIDACKKVARTTILLTSPNRLADLLRSIYRFDTSGGYVEATNDIGREGDVLELAILGLLQEQELHGYELKKRLSDALGPFPSVSFGSLYPALARLESAGAVRVVPLADDRDRDTPPLIPMTGALSGERAAFRARSRAAGRERGIRGSRGKKVYALTDRGQRLFQELLATGSRSSEDDRSFNLLLAFARYLPPEARLGVLERRRAYLTQRLARARAASRSSRERLDAYTRELMDHGTEATEHDISWIDRLIAAEHASGDAPAAPAISTQEDSTR
jgi:DNA-binding PadR family transcriptional regulator